MNKLPSCACGARPWLGSFLPRAVVAVNQYFGAGHVQPSACRRGGASGSRRANSRRTGAEL
jgi:hypothetical protein